MKILFATFGFLPAVSWGGPVQVVYNYALELLRRGHEVTVCASNRLSKRDYILRGSFEGEVDGIRVLYLQTYMIANWPGTTGPTFLSLRGVRRLWHRVRGADVVHVHSTRNTLSLVAVIFARIQRKPYVLQPHGTLPRIMNSVGLKRLFDWLLMGIILDGAASFIALQEREAQQIVGAGGDPRRIQVVPNGLDSTAYTAETYRGRFRRRFDIDPGRKIALFLGRINRKKGTDLLVEAFARVPEPKRKEMLLVIAGPDDGQLEEVQSLVASHGLGGQVMFTGVLSGDDVKAAYVDCDVFVLPCRVDTFPMTLIEACQAGAPIVLTETCEIADLLADRAATVVPFNADALAGAMCRLMNDVELQARYRQGAQDLMRSVFSIEAVGDRLEEIYVSITQDQQA